MTIGLAGMVWDNSALVAICDFKISLPNFAADNIMDKLRPIHQSWQAICAGDDVTAAEPIFSRVRELLGFYGVAASTPLPEEKSTQQVAEAFRAAFLEVRRTMIETEVLGSFGLSIAEFVSEGRQKFGPDLYSELCRKIQEYPVKCEFLVFGFDKERIAHVLAAYDPGLTSDYSGIGFWCIGSGQQQALSSLFFARSQYHPQARTLDYVLWDLCAAKFMAESESGVGRTTLAVVIRPNGKLAMVTPEEMEALRKMWERYGRPRRPKNLEGLADEVECDLYSPPKRSTSQKLKPEP